MIRFKIFSVFFLFFLISCEKEIEFKGEGKQPLLVLDAILETDAPPLITLTRSVFFLTNSNNSADASVNGATVKLTNVTDGIDYFLTTSASGIYTGNTNIKQNTVYRIEISHPDFPSISSEMRTTSNIALIDFDTSSIAEPFDTKHLVTFHFQDPIGLNFYSVITSSVKKVSEYDYDNNLLSIDTITSTDIAYTEDPSLAVYTWNTFLFNDLLFEAKLKSMKLQIYQTYYGSGGGTTNTEYLSRTVKLINLTEDAFKYFKTIENNQPNGPFNDPTNVFTNVKNGLGIFGSYSVSELTK
jgi:hypothetical protein